MNELLGQTLQKMQQENYQKMISGDFVALQKELANKQYVISDLKAIHVVPGEVIKNIRNGNHELKWIWMGSRRRWIRSKGRPMT